ncbi:MAG TPA: hypothetical protein VFN49_08600, partial [Candidatus Aquilonibacter sp.]|nr:hypothetical protein [Candidatus Aquilonibacter sp.]
MSFRRISLSLLASSAILAACGGGAHQAVVPSASTLAPAAGSGALAASADKQAQHRHGTRVRHVAFLSLTIDKSANGTFALANGDIDDVLFSSKDAQTIPVPAFTLACSTSTDRRSHWESHGGRCRLHLRGDDNDHDRDDKTTWHYYVREIVVPSGHFDEDDLTTSIVTGPETATTANSVSMPAANAPLALAAGTRYLFDLVKTDGALATPTPPPTPTPAPPSDPCPQLSNYAPLAPPKTITTAAGDPTVVTVLAQSAGGAVQNISCAVGGKMYFTGKLFVSGTTYQFDPSTGATTQWSTVAADEAVVGGDGHVYEQGAFGRNKASQIAQFSLDGSTQTFVPGGLLHMMVTGPDGNIYTVINNGSNDTVEQVKPDATVSTFALPAACGTSIDADASGPAGKLWFHGTSCGIVSMTTTGAFSTVAPLADSVNRMATGPDGALYATDVTTDAIVRIDPASGATAGWMLPSNLQPGGLTRGYGPDLWFDAFDNSTSTEKLAVINLA